MGNKVLGADALRSVQTAVKGGRPQGVCLVPTSPRLLHGSPAANSPFHRGIWQEPHPSHFTSDQFRIDSSTCENQWTPDPAVWFGQKTLSAVSQHHLSEAALHPRPAPCPRVTQGYWPPPPHRLSEPSQVVYAAFLHYLARNDHFRFTV